jgi:hypothetical protein
MRKNQRTLKNGNSWRMSGVVVDWSGGRDEERNCERRERLRSGVGRIVKT